MYAAKVKVGIESKEVPASWEKEIDPEWEAESSADPLPESIEFTAGNPRVEHTTGVVHLYREIPDQKHSGVTPALPAGHGDRICLLAVPMEVGVGELCTFLGAFLESVNGMQLVRRQEAKRTYLAFLTFISIKEAALFYKNYNGKAFSLLEPHICCKLVFIKDLQIVSSTREEDAQSTPVGATELPSCPVCLERLDEHISGVVTTVCNHKFHSQCLRLWGDESCPVCRYTSSEDTMISNCATCGTSQDLWICLICGHIGCGRYRQGHSRDHWKETGHVYALELQTQRVWDYVGDGYVHRLIQSKTDGKLVEVPAPVLPGSSSHSSGLATANEAGDLADEGLQDALFNSKLDMFASEYNNLLVTQLDSQRKYFEGLMQKAEDSRLEEAASRQEKAVFAEDLRHAIKSKAMLEAKVAELTSKLKSLDVARKNAEAQNDSLVSNKAAFMQKLKASESKCTALTKENTELKDQVRDLMLFLEARSTIEQDASLQGGSVTVADAAKNPRRRTSKKK